MKTRREPPAKMASAYPHVHVLSAIICLLGAAGSCTANEWQWSTPDGNARDYLWIPPNCQRVRAIVIANHNMIEQGILEHARMRQTLAALDFAEVWCVPVLEQSFDFRAGAGEHLQRVLGCSPINPATRN